MPLSDGIVQVRLPRAGAQSVQLLVEAQSLMLELKINRNFSNNLQSRHSELG